MADQEGPGWLTSERRAELLQLTAGGRWTLADLAKLDRESRAVTTGSGGGGRARIDLAQLTALDTAGAWLVHRIEQALEARGWQVELAGVPPQHQGLLTGVQRLELAVPAQPVRPNGVVRLVARLGRGTIAAGRKLLHLLSFFGEAALAFGRVLLHPGRLRLTSLTHHLEQTCLNALPIVGLIAFLLGIVMAYQGADQLRRFGAEIFTVDLLGISIMREIGILMTAIVVAGRSGSAFTAEIGAMQVNEEIDALRTIGLDPMEVLVLPRALALMIALPLLGFFAVLAGLFGGGLMAVLALDLSPAQFLTQLQSAVSPAHFWVGMIKAPVFAFMIALVGCYEGLNVTGSAESVGRLTTQSVVVSIFLVIVVDAMFSILFSYLGV